MRYEWKRLTGFIVIVLFLMNCAVAAGAQTQTSGNSISPGMHCKSSLTRPGKAF